MDQERSKLAEVGGRARRHSAVTTGRSGRFAAQRPSSLVCSRSTAALPNRLPRKVRRAESDPRLLTGIKQFIRFLYLRRPRRLPNLRRTPQSVSTDQPRQAVRGAKAATRSFHASDGPAAGLRGCHGTTTAQAHFSSLIRRTTRPSDTESSSAASSIG